MGLILEVPNNFSDKIILDVAKINQWHFLECGKLNEPSSTSWWQASTTKY